jgi:hypothetical protein
MNRFPIRLLRVLVLLVLMAAGLPRPAAAQLRGACGSYALCLGGNRYQIAAQWRDPATGDGGVARAVTLTPDSGYFWFFDQSNIEVTAKVLDGCGSNGFEWIFVSGMTNLPVTLTVIDAQTGDYKLYRNPEGTAFIPVQDTAAFPNCPGAPAGDVGGSWAGTFRPTDEIDCNPDADPDAPAQATFEQDGDSVTGTLSAEGACGFHGVQFAGSQRGNELTGVVTGGGLQNARAFGVVSSSTLDLTVVNGFGLAPGGTMHLRR